MRSLRSALAVVAAAAVMACQTTVAASRPLAPVSAASSSLDAHNAVTAQSRTESAVRVGASATAADSKKSRTIWILIGVAAAVVIAALLISGGGSDSVY